MLSGRPQLVAFAAGIAILGTLAVWLMISARVAKAPAGPEAMQQMSEQADRNAGAMRAALEERLAEQQNDAKRQRMDSPLGQALFRRCADWSDLYDSHPAPSTRENRDTACDDYRRYVLDGVLPD